METCTAEFARLSASLQGPRCDGNPFITLTSPFALQNWTQPVIEVVMVAGAIACLIHALRWYRHHGDASNLVVWITGVVAVMLIEPMSYFPQWFGLEKSLGLTFVHNLFSVQLFYDRMPLYIIAMYPVFGYISYVLVQRAGIFKKYNAVVGALSVAFVFHCLFEIIDTLGPQWKWWVWSTELSTSTPALGVAPYLNIQAFTIVLPFGMALGAQLICRVPHRGGWVIARDVLIVSLLVWPLQFVAALPATIVNLLGGSLGAARFISLWTDVALAAAVGAFAFVGAYRARRADPALVPDGVQRDHFPLLYTCVYLICVAIFWIAGLQEYFAAHNGITPSGGQIGSFPYAIMTYVLSIVLLTGAYAGTTARPMSATTANDRSEVPA